MDTILLPLLDGLRTSLGEAVADTMGGEPCALAIVPGAIVVADWCTCGGNGNGCGGMAWVRLDRVFPSSQRFPSPDASTKTACATVLAAVIEVGVLRCVPRVKGKGTPPKPAEQTQAALVAADDALAMARAITCLPAINRRPAVLGTWNPRDSGDCGGGAMTVTVQLVPRRP